MTEDEKSRPGGGGFRNTLTPDSTAPIDFLNWLYGTNRDDRISICSFKPFKSNAAFTSNADAVAYAQNLDSQGAEGTYFRLTTLPAHWEPRKPGARGDAEESAYAYALAADLDLNGPGHVAKKLPYPDTHEDLIHLLDKAGLPEPSAWLHSGGGEYPIWKFAERVPAADAADLSGALHRHLIGWSNFLGWTMDNTNDMARVYRLPGTHNRKPDRTDQPVAIVVSMDGPVYEVAALSAILTDAPTAPGVVTTPTIPRPVSAPPAALSFVQPSNLFPAVTGRKNVDYTDETALAWLGEQVSTLKAKFSTGGVYVAMSGFVLSCLHFETGFPHFMSRALIIEEIAKAAKEVHGWEGLDSEDMDKIQRTFQKWDSGRVDDMWNAVRVETTAPAERKTRRVDLAAFLDGSYVPPVPSVGMGRSDGKMLIYPERWHTVIGPNGTGKSFLALAHAIAEMKQGRTVAYAHFEESSPGGTLTRLRAMAPELTTEEITRLFVWLDCSSRWREGEWAQEMQEIQPSFVILDGINRACTQHGWDPSDINAPGSYGAQFVTPARVTGAAVLSLGHPPKAKGRETERHGFGSTAWLDDLEGVGFRLIPSTKRIKEGAHGYAMLYSVKDRYGQVEKGLEPADGKDMDGWYVVGSFWVDSTTAGRSTYGIKPSELNEEGNKKDALDVLGEGIVAVLMQGLNQDGAFDSLRTLGNMLREGNVKFKETDLAPAVDRLHRRGTLDSPPVAARKSRPGALSLTFTASREGLMD